MAEGRQHSQWNHTASVLAMLYNTFRGRGARALEPRDFHPLMKRETTRTTLKQLAEMGVLKPPRTET